MTIYEMALSRIVAGFVVAIGRLIEIVFRTSGPDWSVFSCRSSMP
jgi:hypothetical protein